MSMRGPTYLWDLDQPCLSSIQNLNTPHLFSNSTYHSWLVTEHSSPWLCEIFKYLLSISPLIYIKNVDLAGNGLNIIGIFLFNK